MKTRPTSVAGTFYPKDPDHLEQLLETYFQGKTPGVAAQGIVSPHAGYVYSGETAACAFSAIAPEFDGTFVILGPSHRGFLTCASAIPWETPLGTVDVDSVFVQALGIEIDERSHREEHSIETQVPFIKYRFPRVRIAPIMVGDQDMPAVVLLGERIARAVRETGSSVRIVASSDFSHYIPEERARRDDLYAIEALRTLDIPEFYRRIEERGVSACGYGPIAAMCTAAAASGAREARLLRYSTSGDVTRDTREVVGYAAIAVV
ncbi:MAG: AmmeMemoRadiSam system protein B [Methanomicrobiales archaeon]|nr:AmmeMemoRadiSam system protein B [Methanomicrobiales archaeon]